VIEATKLDGQSFYVSPHQIESIEENPDTVLIMISGRKIIVRESASDVIERIVDYRKELGTQDTMSKTPKTDEGS